VNATILCLCVPPWGSPKDAAKDCEFCEATGEIVVKEQPVDMNALAEKAALEEGTMENERLGQVIGNALRPRDVTAEPATVRVTVTAAELQPGDVILSIGGLSSRVLGVNQRPRYVEVETEFGNGGHGIGLHPKGERVFIERVQH
jgi:hypothetical protein